MAEEQTIPTDLPEGTGADAAFPANQAEDAAATGQPSQQETEQSSAGEPAGSLPGIDDELRNFANSRGLELSTPSEIKAAKMARDSQQDFHAKRHAEKLKSSVTQASDDQAEELAAATGQDPELLKRLYNMEVRQNVRDFWDDHPEARALESNMAKIIQSRPHLVHDLEAVYALAQVRSSDSIKSEGGREALETLANKQRTAAPSGAAVSSAINTQPAITRAVIAQKTAAGDVNWLNKNQSKINQMMAEGKL